MIHFLRGLTGYSPEAVPADLESVTLTGAGTPGTAIDGPAWRTAFHDPQRTSWSDDQLQLPLEPRWQRKIVDPPKSDFGIQWEFYHPYSYNIAGPVAADGLTVITLPHRHEVVALDAE